MADVFISYASADAQMASALSDALRRRGLKVFLDSQSLVAGEGFEHKIVKAIQSADAVAVLLSEQSLRSKYVENELRAALGAKKIIFPILLDQHGKENWVWPLVSDRLAIRVNQINELDGVANDISAAVGFGSRRRLKRAITFVAMASAILGGLVVWVLQRFLR